MNSASAPKTWKTRRPPGVVVSRLSCSEVKPISRRRRSATVARTRGRRGITPVVAVSGSPGGRVSIAGMVCYRPGHRSRLIYRPHRYQWRAGEVASFTWTDYRDLLITAHRHLDAPIVVIWDNLNWHTCAEMQWFIQAGDDWRTVVRLPPYAPDLNPAEGIWSLLNRGVLANLAVCSLDHLIRVIEHGLKKIQYCPHLIDGCLAETGLLLKPP
ncbi:transposase [Streptosporangium roseum]